MNSPDPYLLGPSAALERRRVEIERELRDALPHVPGWCSIEKALYLVDTILVSEARLCVEIGVFGGSSLLPQALALRETGGRIVGIDPWTTDAALEHMIDDANVRWWSEIDLHQIYLRCAQMIREEHLDAVVELRRSRSADEVSTFENGTIDLLHVDGNHAAERSSEDVRLYLPKVRPGGFVFFDDVSWCEGGRRTATSAIEQLEAECRPVAIVGDCAVFRRLGA